MHGQTVLLKMGGKTSFPNPARGTWVLVAHGVASVGFSQTFGAAPVWVVNHNLGRQPSSTLVRNAGGSEIEASVLHVSINQLNVYFDAPTPGSVEIF